MTIGRLQLWLEQMYEATVQSLRELMLHLPAVATSAQTWPASE